MKPLEGKEIILGVSGGIAVYKAVDILRHLTRNGARVTVVMTRHAQEFVTPLTFQVLSGNPVYSDMFKWDVKGKGLTHISIAERGDILLVAPATANIIGKFANGIADDLLSTLFLSVTCPILIAPSMNEKMYYNIVVQENIKRLSNRNIEIIEPMYGELACGDEGKGRLADIDLIIKKVIELLYSINSKVETQRVEQQGEKEDDLSNRTILITAGPTQEPLDPVRYLSNPSSGKMGYALAERAKRRGAEVILISGPTSLPVPSGVTFIPVRRAEEMEKAVFGHIDRSDIVIMSAAVSDFEPKRYSEKKIPKSDNGLVLELKRTHDILANIGLHKKDKIIVGFAAETDDIIAKGEKKLKDKRLDLIVVNDISDPDIGFRSDFNKVSIIDSEGKVEHLPLMSKMRLADIIIDRVIAIEFNKGYKRGN
ncbi:MAG: bifunctional phosphopantothenoylcysteine decarboxylase/phosphopantothenate--cysteine ligase CoaBC [Nitrospinae bacterium]|nr:bifunctional phosphopantothenoylcysteine decarboxylase/phosphopantothenate--cysteine ligase CoaBC [Nitrospinota bacterium]